mmetsp:Transcript_8130/g.24017  ORF Transcript_8130/g.24017 Transcript_8130/m.24017 type:complete len:227 (+) Transcript_8130:2584-3264(+)
MTAGSPLDLSRADSRGGARLALLAVDDARVCRLFSPADVAGRLLVVSARDAAAGAAGAASWTLVNKSSAAALVLPFSELQMRDIFSAPTALTRMVNNSCAPDRTSLLRSSRQAATPFTRPLYCDTSLPDCSVMALAKNVKRAVCCFGFPELSAFVNLSLSTKGVSPASLLQPSKTLTPAMRTLSLASASVLSTSSMNCGMNLVMSRPIAVAISARIVSVVDTKLRW